MAELKDNNMVRVAITSDSPSPRSVKIADQATGKMVEGCYAFEIRGSFEETTKATLFCHQFGKVSIVTDAEMVYVPIGLQERARQLSAKYPEIVAKAFGELLGISISEHRD